MKKTVLTALLVLACSLIIAALPLAGEEEIYEDVIRLHVLAASDSEEDQAKKLCVRDAILAEWSGMISEARDRKEAEQMLDAASLDGIRQTAERTLRELGDASEVRVTLSQEEYPTRDYGSFALPGGTYLSLRVIIGEGSGQNWWCVLFPPLCTAGALQEVPLGLSGAEMDMICKGKKQVRFRALELLSSFFDR